MIPAPMTGGWVRAGLAVNGAHPVEDQVVWWLQAPSRHADLRVPATTGAAADRVICFAGTTSWQEPALTWTPELELDRSGTVDTGVISWDGPDLLEAGTWGTGAGAVPYVERWCRLPGSSGELWALSSPTGRLVRTGGYALSIVDLRPRGGEFSAVAWVFAGGNWVVDHCWPAHASAPQPPDDVDARTRVVTLSDGVAWTVDEYASVG